MHNHSLWEGFENISKPVRGTIPAKQFDYATNISLQYNYLYMETPKAACSSIKTSLQKMELHAPNFHREHFEDIHNRAFSPLIKASQIGNLKQFLERDDIFTFCFVRNPYTRLLAAYLDKIVKNRPAKINILRHMGHPPTDMHIEISFAEFVQVVSQQRAEDMDPHWRIQYYHTCQPGIHFNTVGRIESFNRDFSAILARLNPQYEQYLSTEQRHSTQSNRQLSRYYTPKIRSIVADIYAADFDFFGYSTRLPD